jgi:hypothetical protein
MEYSSKVMVLTEVTPELAVQEHGRVTRLGMLLRPVVDPLVLVVRNDERSIVALLVKVGLITRLRLVIVRRVTDKEALKLLLLKQAHLLFQVEHCEVITE